VDIDFLVQVFQLKYGARVPALRTPNTWRALDALRETGFVTQEQHSILRDGYKFLLRVQSRLRIVQNRSLDELPQGEEEVEKLARRLGFETTAQETAGGRFLSELERHTRQTRDLFLRLLERERETNV
jgi:glutamate-ammonia-ligase adenylyltransferase